MHVAVVIYEYAYCSKTMLISDNEWMKPAETTETTGTAEFVKLGSKKEESEFNLKKKWGSECIDSGFQAFPDVLLRCQRFLDLEPIDVVILLNITMHWWRYDDLPYPRPSFIAKRMAVSTRTVERRIFRLQQRGLLERRPSEEVRGKTVRKYDLSGLTAKLKEYAEVNLANRGWSEEVPDHE